MTTVPVLCAPKQDTAIEEKASKSSSLLDEEMLVEVPVVPPVPNDPPDMEEASIGSDTENSQDDPLTQGSFNDDVADADRNAISSDNLSQTNRLPGTRRQVSGAAVVGGVAGLVLAGPILGLIAAGGAVAVAKSRSKAGRAARAGGDAVADAGVRIQKYNEKNKVLEKTSNGIAKGRHWVVERCNAGNRKKEDELKHQALLVA